MNVRRIVLTTWRQILAGLALAAFSAAAQAPLDVRIALVIGNGGYAGNMALANPVNDSKAMSVVLARLGFTVIEIRDGKKEQMAQAIAQVRDMLKGKQGVGMLYYAGHGLQQDWHNFMVPVDASLGRAADIPQQTIDVEMVIQAFKLAGNRMNILVLDACRDNPFTDKSGSKGLSQVDAPPGTYLAFATSPGNVAEDGDAESGNGLFTKYLLQELQKPAKIEDVFKRVRLHVRKQSQGRQIPWDSSSLEDDFYFNDGVKYTFKPEDMAREIARAKELEAQLKRQAEEARQRELQIAQEREQLKRQAEEARQRELQLAQEREREKQKLAEAQRLQELEARKKAEEERRQREIQLARAQEEEKRKAAAAALALEQARKAEEERLKELQFAQAQFEAQRAAERERLSQEQKRERQFAQEKAEWDKIKDSKNPDDFYDYLSRYPNGMISQQATFMLEQLAKAKISPQKDKNGIVQTAGEARFKVGDKYEFATLDSYNGREIRRQVQRVNRIENNLAYLSGEGGEVVMTLDGGLVKGFDGGGTFTFDPPRVDLPGDELAVGKRWLARTIQSGVQGGRPYSIWREDEVKIVALEDVTVPAGTFKAFRIEMSSVLQNGLMIKRTYWYEPGWGLNVKAMREIRGMRGNPTRETNVLLARSRG